MRNAIVDKNVVIEPGAQLGVDLELDRKRFVVSAGGVVVVGKGARVPRLRADESAWHGWHRLAEALSVALLTREYPPDVYGGAGVHVEYLARELARLVEVTVHCWGAPRPPAGPGEPRVVAHEPWAALDGPAPVSRGAARRVDRPDDGRRSRGREHRAQPHVVREPRRPPREADPRDPPRRDRPQPRAAAAVEGRAARRRLPRLELLRAHGARGRRRGDRRLEGDARRHPRRLPGDRRPSASP